MQRYLEIVAASNSALRSLARLQADLVAEVYITPAYVQLQSEIALSHARRAVSTLNEFCRKQESNLV
ncbi:MAG: hypothetical protein P8168_06390, partial [Deltaproteobacteria bacterium]